jgi:hypothetical protein
MLSIATHEAAQMLKAGWTIEYRPGLDQIAWRDPKGISGSNYFSNDLYPSAHAVLRAFEMGHIHINDRVIEAELDLILASAATTESKGEAK